MKPNDLKNIYSSSTQDFHNAMLCSLVRLNEKAQRRYKRHRVLKLVIICIIIACLCTTSVLAASNFYGVFTDKVSNYGMNVNIVTEEDKKLPEYVKLTLDYLPEDVIVTPNTLGEKYSLKGQAVFKNCSFSVVLLDDEFNITNSYIVDSNEKIINGNRVIINTRKFEDKSDITQTIFYEYFDDLGAVLVGWCDNMVTDEEVELIIAGAEVSEGTEDDYFERVDLASELSEQITNYQEEEEYLYGIVDPYESNYEAGIYGKSFEYEDEGDFSVNVKSFELHDNVSDLDKNNFNFIEYRYNEPDDTYETYFDENGDIIPDYTRIQTDYGDGINSIDKSNEVEAKRHFVLAELEITGLRPLDDYNIGFDIMDLLLMNLKYDDNDKLTQESKEYAMGTMVYNNGVDEGMNLLCIGEGETRDVIVGFFVDEDHLDNLYFSVVSRRWSAIDNREDAVCFPLER